MLPFEAPLHWTFCVETEYNIGEGTDKLNGPILEIQPLLSVTVTEYVPGERFIMS